MFGMGEESDPQIRMDANIGGKTYLWNVMNETDEWLTYDGKLMDREDCDNQHS